MAKARPRSSAEGDQTEEPANPRFVMTREHTEFLQANTEAVTALEKRLQVVQQILDEVANELGWLARNIQDLSIGAQGGSRVEESVYCMECESEPIRTLAEALRRGWSELMLHEDRYMGMCPDCGSAADRPAATPAETVAHPRKIIVDAEQFARAMESVEVLSDNSEGLRMTCSGCHAVADLPPGEAVQKGGWQEVGEDADGYVGLCPACAKREACDPTKMAGTTAAVASHGGYASANAVAAEPPRGPTQPPQPAVKRRTKQQPLYMRMYTEEHLTALVRAVGYAGFPDSEGQERMRPLVEKFGEQAMRAAIDELVEIDNTQNPPWARLTPQARKLAVGLLGRPPEAPAPPPHVPPPPPTQESAASAEVPKEGTKRARGRRK